MANKRINDFTEVTTPEDNSNLLLESSNGITLKSKLTNLLKRLFNHREVYRDILGMSFGFGAAGGKNAPTFKQFRSGFYLWAFENGPQIQEGYLQVHLMHDLKAGEDLTFHIHWSHNEAVPTGNIKWNADYSIARGYEAGTFTVENTLSVVQTVGAQYTHHISDDDAMVIPFSSGEIEPDTVILIRIWRDSTDVQDTFNGDAFFIYADIHCIIDKVGTTERNRPFLSGNFGS